MSETFLRLYRERVEAALKPHIEIYGESAPVVVMGLRLLAEAEDVEREIAEERVPTPRAAELTGWNEETLQKYARAALAGDALPPKWSGLQVEGDVGGPYVFVVGTIPQKNRAA